MGNMTLFILIVSGAAVLWLGLHLLDVRRQRKQREEKALIEEHRAHQERMDRVRAIRTQAWNQALAGGIGRSLPEVPLQVRQAAMSRVRVPPPPVRRTVNKYSRPEDFETRLNYLPEAMLIDGAVVAAAPEPEPYEGKGGSFGGAGASGSWADSPAPAPSESCSRSDYTSSSSSDSSSSSSSSDASSSSSSSD